MNFALAAAVIALAAYTYVLRRRVSVIDGWGCEINDELTGAYTDFGTYQKSLEETFERMEGRLAEVEADFAYDRGLRPQPFLHLVAKELLDTDQAWGDSGQRLQAVHGLGYGQAVQIRKQLEIAGVLDGEGELLISRVAVPVYCYCSGGQRTSEVPERE